MSGPRARRNAIRELRDLLVPHVAGLDPDGTEALRLPADPCALYERVKGPLGLILPVLALVPIYGAPIVAAIKLLQALADRACPPRKAA